jgi:hypothetical protein
MYGVEEGYEQRNEKESLLLFVECVVTIHKHFHLDVCPESHFYFPFNKQKKAKSKFNKILKMNA